jgi:BASS family bile acid:Na+ symporter
MIVTPLVVATVGAGLGLDKQMCLALFLATTAPPSSGSAAFARMIGLDPAIPLVVTLICMVIAPFTVPALAGWFADYTINPFDLAWRLALLVGAAEGLALLLRRYAASMLSTHGKAVDGVVLASLLIFALASMAGVRAQISADGHGAALALGVATLSNISLQAAGFLFTKGSLQTRLSVSLVFGNRNVGLVWSALGAAVTPSMGLYFAATQLPIYILPRLTEVFLRRAASKGNTDIDKSAKVRS